MDTTVEEHSTEIFAGDRPGYPGNLRRYWHPIALSENVTRQPQRFVLLEEPLVAYRVGDQPVVFKDLCIHRGTALSLGSVTEEGHLQCPYHGWQYDSTGACVRIPAKEEGLPIPRKANAIVYRAEEKYGVVWVALDDPLFPIPPFPMNEYGDPKWKTFFAFVQTWQSSAGRVLENFCDWSHIPFVHEGLLGTPEIARPALEPSEIWEKETEYGYSLGYSYEQIDQSQLFGKGVSSIRREFVIYLPFTVHLYKYQPDRQHKLLASLIVSPISPKESALYSWCSRDYDLDTADQVYLEYEEAVFAQDQRIVESQRPEEIPTDLKEELHIKVPDAFSVEYRRVLQRIEEVTPFLPY